MADYANFRQRLDAVLRTQDVEQVSAFLIAEKQWSPGQPEDAQFRDVDDDCRQPYTPRSP